jgi:hypothetical protein
VRPFCAMSLSLVYSCSIVSRGIRPGARRVRDGACQARHGLCDLGKVRRERDRPPPIHAGWRDVEAANLLYVLSDIEHA